MHDLQTTAVRVDKRIEVTLAGQLADSCVEASVTGTYPGNIVHIVDPGEAEVFVTERRDGHGEVCTLALVPWVRTVTIDDQGRYDTLAVHLNGQQVQRVPVSHAVDRFAVYALTSSLPGPLRGCSVARDGTPVLAIYSRVFGPDGRAACEAFVTANCRA